jgi:hypothetical protein
MALNGLGPSELLAASCYSRGLWSPVLIWRAISNKPYRGEPIQWGLDRDLIKQHLKRASLIGTGFVILYVALGVMFFKMPSVWIGLSVLVAMFLEWTLVPWLVLRLGWVKSKPHIVDASDGEKIKKLVCKDTTSALPDLGFLLREATFSVDSNARETGTGEQTGTGSPQPSEFYTAVAGAAAKIPSFRVLKLTIVPSEELQPGSASWGSWYNPRCSSECNGSEEISRLVILAEQPSIDGFASAEFLVQEVKPHFSFLLRLRWMPPLRARLHRLGYLHEQRIWWRAGLLPALFVGVLLLAGWVAGNFVNLIGPYFPALAPYGVLLPTLGSQLVAVVVPLVVFGPIALFLLIALYRLARYLWGVLHALTGTHLQVRAPASFRYLSTRTMFEAGDEFQWGVACSQITQEVVTNSIVGVLRKYGIDTRSIKDEVRTFINEGVYMTGGSIAAENMVVGNLARILRFRGKMSRSRSGRRPLVGRSQKAA